MGETLEFLPHPNLLESAVSVSHETNDEDMQSNDSSMDLSQDIEEGAGNGASSPVEVAGNSAPSQLSAGTSASSLAEGASGTSANSHVEGVQDSVVDHTPDPLTTSSSDDPVAEWSDQMDLEHLNDRIQELTEKNKELLAAHAELLEKTTDQMKQHSLQVAELHAARDEMATQLIAVKMITRMPWATRHSSIFVWRNRSVCLRERFKRLPLSRR